MNAALDVPNRIADEAVYSFLDRALANMIARTDLSLGVGERGRLYGWYWGYYGRAAVDMFAATGDLRFAHLVERTIEALLNVRDDRLGMIDDERGIAFPSWGTKYKTGERSNEITTAGLIVQPMLEYARIAGTSWIADAAVETLLAFQSERRAVSGGRYYFVHRTQAIIEALNHSSLYGSALVHASHIFNYPWLAETADGLFKYHLSFVDRRGEGISWPYSPSPDQDRTTLRSEAIWKAAASIELPISLAESGRPDAEKFLQETAFTLARHPVTLRNDYPQFIGHDSHNPVDGARASGGLTSFIAAFLQIDSPELRNVIFELMRNRPELFPNAWKGGSRAMIMAWAHMRISGVV